MRQVILAAFIAVCLCAGAAFAEKTPDWIKGKSKQYPKETYVLGVGSGENLDAARSSARAEIAKVFSVRVAQLAKDVSSERTSKKGSKTSGESSSETGVNTEVATNGLLEGVEIPETWYSEKKKTYFALAAMDKPKTISLLSSIILDSEAAGRKKLEEAKASASPFEKVKLLNGALKDIKTREDAVSRKRIVDKVYTGDISLASDKSEIEQLRKKEMENILFIINTGSDATGLKETIGSKITGMGFKLLDKAPEKRDNNVSYITIRCGIEVMPLDKPSNDWKFYEWSIRGFISDLSSPGENFAVISKRGQSSQLTDETAKNKAINEASAAMAEEIERQLDKNVTGKE